MVDKVDIQTYCSSFTMKIQQRPIKKKDLVEMSLILTTKLNELYSNKYEVDVLIEDITEGGFEIRRRGVGGWYTQDNNTKMYKTIRLGLKPPGHFSFPMVPLNVVEEWKDDDEIVWKEGMILSTFLKAFYNAPKWTKRELDIFREVFYEYHIKCSKKNCK